MRREMHPLVLALYFCLVNEQFELLGKRHLICTLLINLLPRLCLTVIMADRFTSWWRWVNWSRRWDEFQGNITLMISSLDGCFGFIGRSNDQGYWREMRGLSSWCIPDQSWTSQSIWRVYRVTNKNNLSLISSGNFWHFIIFIFKRFRSRISWLVVFWSEETLMTRRMRLRRGVTLSRMSADLCLRNLLTKLWR